MPKVKIYTTPTCVYCKMAKQLFDANGIKYEELNVAEDASAFEEMKKKSRQTGVPVIDINGEIFIGFDRRGLLSALNIPG